MVYQTDFMKLISQGAKEHRNSPEGLAIVVRLSGEPINPTTARQIVEGMIKVVSDCGADGQEAGQILSRKLEAWAPNALESIRRNGRMHNGGEWWSGRCDTVDRYTADALIVNFANAACLPTELAMHSDDLQQ